MDRPPEQSIPLAPKYDAFYRREDPEHVYPVEFVVRAYLGNYPRLAREPIESYKGRTVLDLGFGDGRNMQLLSNLGMAVSGVEISNEICQRTTARMKRLGIDIDARVGTNASIPFAEATFDHLLACHACYYVETGTTFDDNAREIARVMKPGARFVFSAPLPSTYILRDSEDAGGGHRRITQDPYGLRNGTVFRAFNDENEIETTLRHLFEDFHIGSCRNDFWGIEEHAWTVVCRRRR